MIFPTTHAQIIHQSGTYDFVDPNDMNVKIIVYNYLQDSYDTSYIISTSPHEYLSIGIDDKKDNYTNDKDYAYFMASVANTSTLVEFTVDVTIKKIEISKMTKIEVETGKVINGPFIAYIKKKCKMFFQYFFE